MSLDIKMVGEIIMLLIMVVAAAYGLRDGLKWVRRLGSENKDGEEKGNKEAEAGDGRNPRWAT